MTASRVLFFSCEAGGAEVLIPVIRMLGANPDHHVTVACYGHAHPRFARRSIPTAHITPIPRDDYGWLDKFRPDILITSATSLPAEDMSEKHLWCQARQRHIPSIAFLDQWQNYAIRFSGPADSDHLKFQPDFINCLNRIGYEEMQAVGFETKRLIMLGHPYLDSLATEAAALDRRAIRNQMGISGATETMLFISEPIREYCGDSRGYDQYSVLERFLECCRDLSPSPAVMIKLHPKENPEAFRQIISACDNAAVRLLNASVPPLECLLAADRIFGMSSVMLLESFVLGKETVSIQPNLQIDDPCVLSKYGYIKRLENISPADLSARHAISGSVFEYRFDSQPLLKLMKTLTGRSEVPGHLPRSPYRQVPIY